MDPQALDLATKTLAVSLDSLMLKGAPFAPLVQVVKGGAVEQRRVAAGKNDDAAAIAKQMAAQEPGADATAYAVEGSISFNGARSDGIIVEAWNFRTNRGARVGLRYELKGVRKKPSLIGSPLHLGRGGWFDPEEGEPEEAPTFAAVTPVPLPVLAPLPVIGANGEIPVVDEGFGPPPAPSSLAPADIAPPPPARFTPAEPPALPRVFSAAPVEPGAASAPSGFGPPPTATPDFGPPPIVAPEPEPEPEPSPARRPLPEWPAPDMSPPEPVAPPATHEFGPPPTPMPDFGPPPTSSPVLAYPPPGFAEPVPVPVPVQIPAPVPPPEPEPAPAPAVQPPAPIAESAPVTAAHPVEVVGQPEAVLPTYTPVPLQRNETPLGNRAMFAGIMELATKSRSFPAFAIVQKDGDWEQVTMIDTSLDQAAASVRAYARSRTDAEFIAFAIDTFVAVDGVPVTAVVVEVWEYATRVSFSVAQRYVLTGTPPSPRLSGRPLMRTQTGWVDVPSSMVLGGQVQFGYRDPDPV